MRRGLLDTSVLIDIDLMDEEGLPEESAISTVTLAELSVGPLVAVNEEERAVRQDRLQWAETTFEPIPFGSDAARAFGRVVTAVRAHGRRERSRLADLLIASTALAEGLAVVTRNPDDFAGLGDLVEVLGV